jgi:cobalamin synthase
MKAIKTFRDLLDFFTVIPLGNVKERRVAVALVFLAGL